jgi:hypothetical protein
MSSTRMRDIGGARHVWPLAVRGAGVCLGRMHVNGIVGPAPSEAAERVARAG